MPTRTRTPRKPKPPNQRTDAILTSSVLREPWLVHGFSTRLRPDGKRGDFNLGFTETSSHEETERNRSDFVQAVTSAATGAGKGSTRKPSWTLVQMKQVHSDIIHVLRRAPSAPLTGDGLVTNLPGLLLAAKTADCVPVLIADVNQRAIGAFHAGWRGTAKRIVEKGAGILRREFGCEPGDLRAAIGPCIGACCYEVGEEVMDEFRSQFSYADDLFVENFDVDPVKQKYPNLFLNARAPGHAEISRQIHLDLVEANRRQLLAAGLRDQNIEPLGLCTSCRTDLLFSHRAEHGKTGRMMAAIGIRPHETSKMQK